MNKPRKREDRRAASPVDDIADTLVEPEKSGKQEVNEKIAELSVRGVLDKDSRKPSRVKKLSSKQKKRQAAAKSRADKLQEVLEQKVSDAVSRHKQVLERKKGWDVANELEKKTTEKGQ